MSVNIKMTGTFTRVVTTLGPIIGSLTEFEPRSNRVTVTDDRGRVWRIAARYIIRMERV